uniref:Thioredoxin domain-containing protein n=1 Tax=Ditylum brightwellii TaxID=49249 RepID=A0A6V2QTX9_9STRA|mmetsp:Transcript_13458/g.18046  ORF Transcript_13458/g.18046 Transcript_13458/m.18046 type:complete len:208 (+) Transcript_13458:27-650(+)
MIFSALLASRTCNVLLRRPAGVFGASAVRQATVSTTKRDISVGTDLTKNECTLQKARPWHMNDADSNLAKDNAVSMTDLFQNKKVAVFGVPAPFTGTCTTAHYPPYQRLQNEFKAKGFDAVVCYSVADPYAHYNWGLAMGNDFDSIAFLADADGEWARSNDLERDYTGASLGHRSARFSMVVEDGIVKAFNLVEDAEKDAEVLLQQA